MSKISLHFAGGQLPGTPGVTVVAFTGVVVPGTNAIF